MNLAKFVGVVIVMGVAGCGKSSLARLISRRLDAAMCEADELHPRSNIEKMSNGIALTDKDRAPWLERVVTKTSMLCEEHDCCVVACSALRKSYRDELRNSHDNVCFVYLSGTKELIQQRMTVREGHFMPVSLLDSQFDTLEAPLSENGVVTVNIDQSLEDIASEVFTGLTLMCDL